MKQTDIDQLLNSFFLSNQELESRTAFNEFARSLSSIIIDEFAQDYLLHNPHLSIYLAHTDGSMLIKKMKAFMAFVLTAPIDEEYVKRVHAIGFIHHSIKLEPAKVSYAFWAINEVLDKLKETNPIVEKNKSLMSKLLRFVEHLMKQGYYILEKNIEVDNSSFNAQNELYIALNIHTLNAKKVQLAISDKKNVHLLDEIKESPNQCLFGKVLEKLDQNKGYEYILGVSANTIHTLHNNWHNEFRAIKHALAQQDEKTLNTHNENIKAISKELSSILDATLHESLQDGQLSLRSSMRAMKKMTKLFYNKDYQDIEKLSPHELVYKTIKETILSEFSWAIEDVQLTDSEQKLRTGTVAKMIRHNSESIFITVVLKDKNSSDYLTEIMNLLLEVLELHFFVRDRELSLITFADEAENANKSKDMFLANMSHELRTPINAITGFSQILMMKKDTPDTVKKYVEKINIAGNNLLELVNTILDFAKLESGKMQFNPGLTNISKVLNEVRVLISPLAQKKNINFSMPNIVSLNLYIDSTLFKQVLINLLTNAIKFTHKDGNVSLNIVYDEESHTYKLEVKDDGVGLSQENMAKLFQAFSQVDNSYQKEHKGTGLGLMISKNIIEDLHKGRIWVESEEDKGSSFFIEMPTPMIESHTYKFTEAPKGAQNVLIVEDSPEYQKILIANLEETHNLTITDTVNKAKELLSKNTYDFLILDFFLTDGISSEILHFMEEENITTPSIVISAEDEIHISSSLSGTSNLQCIVNKKNINDICASIRGEKVIQNTTK